MIRRASDWLARALGVPAGHGSVWLWRPSVGPVRLRLYAGVFPGGDEPLYRWADAWRWGLEAGAEWYRWEAIVTIDVLPYRSSEARLRQGLETRCARCGGTVVAWDGAWQADGHGGAMHEGCALSR